MILIYQNKHWSKKRLAKQLLKEWRESTDAAVRGENSLLKYYLRTATPQKEVTLTILAA